MRKFLAILSIFILAPSASIGEPILFKLDAEEIAARNNTKPVSAVKILLIGDSTTAVVGGWGPSFCAFHVNSSAPCINMARAGRSSFSYRQEGSWNIALDEMRAKGFEKTYVLIQFGHNDQPGKPGRSTNLQNEFPNNLRQFVLEARQVGATPILVTPLPRRNFKDGKLDDNLEPWAEAARLVAKEQNAPLLDLHARGSIILQAMGPSLSMQFSPHPPTADVVSAAQTGTTISPPNPSANVQSNPRISDNNSLEPMNALRPRFDYTHLGTTGSDFFANLITDELSLKVPELRKYLIP